MKSLGQARIATPADFTDEPEAKTEAAARPSIPGPRTASRKLTSGRPAAWYRPARLELRTARSWSNKRRER